MYKIVSLGEIANITTGFPFKGELYSDKGIRVIRGENITIGSLRWDNTKCWNLEFEQEEKYSLKENDIVIGMDGSRVGKNRAQIKKTDLPLLLAQRVACVRSTKLSDQNFLYYLIRSDKFEQYVNKIQTGSSIPHISLKQIENFPVAFPPLEIQKSISNILSSLDSKIELNNKINAELEAMAKTIYDYWFVQFDFPNAKGKPYKTSGGKMVWNEELKIVIPECWEVKELESCIDTIIDHRGKTPTKLGGDWTTDENGIIALSAKIVKGGKLINLEQANKVDKELYNKWMPKKLIDGDILMTSEAPAGEFYFILGKTDYCLSQRLFAIRANQKIIIPSYLYYELSKGHGYSQIMGSLSGSTVFGIRQDVLRTIKVVIPSIDIQTKFNNIVLPQLQKIKSVDEENQQLASLRDWLLPMLMNGQVKVKDTENSDSYRKVEEKLSFAAEGREKYKKTTIIKLPIPATKKSFAKQVLAGKIVSLFREGNEFTDIKFQKLQYLAEHIAQADLDWNYYRKMAGPYDNKFMHSVSTRLKNNKWFEESRKMKFKPLAKVDDIEKYYKTYFSPVEDKLNKLFKLLANATEAHSEVIATVYAIWNNLIIRKETVTDEKIVKLFLEWSRRKETYTKKQIVNTIQWLKDKGFEPTGFGYLIKEVKEQ